MNNKNLLYKLLNKYGDLKKFSAGDNIYSFGMPAKNFYLIIKGQVKLFIKDKNDKEKEIACLISGDIMGEAAFIEQAKHTSRATAINDTNILSFTVDNFNKLISKHTAFTEKVIKKLCNRIQILQKAEEKETESNIAEEKINNINRQDISNFYLEGHENYSKIANESFEYYLYTKEIKCPVCSSKINLKKIRNSRLRLKEIRDDLRPIYKDFEPYWYKVWTCPNCFYTALESDFLNLNDKNKKKIQDNFKKEVENIFCSNYNPAFSKPRKLNEVFDAYYLAIKLYKFIDYSKDKLANIWLRISWLYEDIGEKELSKKASYKAMESLRGFYFNNNSSSLSDSQNNKLTLLLSILFYKHGFIKEAIPLLDKLIRNPHSKPLLKNRARDLFIKIRVLQRNSEDIINTSNEEFYSLKT